MATAGKPGPYVVCSSLVPGQAGVIGEHMLIEAELAAGANDPVELSQRRGLDWHAAQHERDDTGVDRSIGQRDSVGGAVGDGDWYRGAPSRLYSPGTQVRLGLDGEYFGHVLWVMAKVEAVTSTDLNDSSVEASEEALTMSSAARSFFGQR